MHRNKRNGAQVIDLEQDEANEILVKAEDLLDVLELAKKYGREPDHIEIEDGGYSIRIFWKAG